MSFPYSTLQKNCFIALLLSLFLVACTNQNEGSLKFTLDEISGEREVLINNEKTELASHDASLILTAGSYNVKINILSEDGLWIFKAEKDVSIERDNITYLITEFERIPTPKQQTIMQQEAQQLKNETALAKNNKRYEVYPNKTVLDKKTKLIWKKCAEGLIGDSCEKGVAIQYNWQETIDYASKHEFAGFSDWRLPTYAELKSLVRCSSGSTPIQFDTKGYLLTVNGTSMNGLCKENDFDTPTINKTIFPNTPKKRYWTASVLIDYPVFAWNLHFSLGSIFYDDIENSNRFRLVRNQSN